MWNLKLRPRWRKIAADLLGNKTRSLLVIASIAIGLFAVGMIFGGQNIIENDMSNSYHAVNPFNIRIISQPFDVDFVKSIERLPGVKSAEGSRSVTVRLLTGPDKWLSINVKVVDFEDMRLSRLKPLQGKYPPDKRELILDINKFEETNAVIGDTLTIKLPSGTIKQIPLTGLVQDMTYGATHPTTFTAPIQGYITFETLEWLEQPSNYNTLYISVSEKPDDEEYIRQVFQQVSRQYERSGLEILTSLIKPNTHPNYANFLAVQGVLQILGLLVVFLSAFLISNTLSAILNQHRRYIGIMKSVGARTSQIVLMYFVFTLTYSLLALLIAIPSGARAAYGFAGIVAKQINFDLQPYRIVPDVVVLQTLIALFVPQLAAAFPILNGARVPVIEALTATGLSGERQKKDWIDRLLESIRGLSNPMLISLRNTFRKKGRLILTLVTLTLSGSIFIAIFNVQATLNQYILMIGRYFKADVVLSFERSYRIDEIKMRLREMPEVDKSEGWAYPLTELIIKGKPSNEVINLFGVPAGSDLVKPTMLAGRWLTPEDRNAIAVNDVFQQNHPDIKPGDTIRLKTNGKESDWVLVGIFQFFGGNQNFAYVNYEYLSHLIHINNQASSFRIVARQQNLTLDQQFTLGKIIEARFKDLGYHVSDVSGGKYLIEQAAGAINFLTLVLLIMAILSAIVGSIGLTGTMSMNVMDRTREIGVMRAIGATDRTVMKLVVVESVMIGLVSWFFSALLSLPISRIMADIICLAIFKSPADLYISPVGFFLWLGIVSILSALASLTPARNAASLTIREVLAYE